MAKKSKKIKKKITLVSRVIATLLLLLSLVFFGMLLTMNVLPAKYITLILGVYFGLFVIGAFFQWHSKIKVGFKYFFDFVSVVMIVAISFGIFYMYKTMDFMGRIGAKDYQIEDYYVLVLKDAKYKKLNDVKGLTIGVSPNDTGSYDEALASLKEKVSIETKDYEDFMKMGADLLNHKLEAIYLTSSQKSMIEEEDETFEGKVRILSIVSIKVKNEVVKKEAKVTEEPFNIYISGIDIYGNISSVSRSDVNMIVTVNPSTHKILLTNIPRDYYVQLHGTTGYKDKLTHAGVYGIDKSIETLEDLLEIDINYYFRVNFSTLVNIVDAIGGVDVYSDYAFTSLHGNYKFEKGINHMNGAQALGFSRERYSFSEGDRQRGKNQQAVLTAIINKALSSKTLITKYTSILESLGDSFQTNMGTDKIYKLVNMQIDKMPSWSIETYSLDGTGASEYTYSYQHQKLYVMIPDEKTVTTAKNKIDAVEQGK